VSVAAVALMAATAAVVGAGSWLGARSPAPVGESESAVVLSSLACTDGSGGTLVEVMRPAEAAAGGPVRASLDACGYREGQQLQVRFVPDDATSVVLAGNESATDHRTGDRLPAAVGIAALLASAAVLAIALRRRQRRTHAGPRRIAAHELIEVDEFNGADEFGGATADGPPDTGLPALVGAVPSTEDRVDDAERSLSPVDLTFPFSSNLAACLQDELFTHRPRSS
jgi:hypothetical protein